MATEIVRFQQNLLKPTLGMTDVEPIGDFMARRPTAPPPPQAANFTPEQMRRGIARIRRRIEELEAFDPQAVQQRWAPEVTALHNGIEEALSAAFGHNTLEYKRYESAADLDRGPVITRIGGPRPGQDAQEAREYLSEGKKRSLLLLQQAIRSLEEEIADQSSPATAQPTKTVLNLDHSKAFVVHGHDEGAREAIARFLERLGITAIILHEQANQGRTVIEKVEAHGDVGFAIILLTPDDEGCLKGGVPNPRARQNVVLELGYFIGRLGRNRVCALKRGELEIPSDFGGVVYQTFEPGGGWKSALGRELEAAGFKIDWNVVMRP